MKINQVIEAYTGHDDFKKLTIQVYQEEETNNEMVLIEGEAEALKFLGNILLALAEAPECNWHMHPKAAGLAYFTNNSTHGVYFHRIPCKNSHGGKSARDINR